MRQGDETRGRSIAWFSSCCLARRQPSSRRSSSSGSRSRKPRTAGYACPSAAGCRAGSGNARRRLLRRRQVAHRRVEVDRPDAAPAQAHDGFGVEVEAAHPALAAHDCAAAARSGRRGSRYSESPMPATASPGWPSQLDICRPLTRSGGALGVEHRLAQHHRAGCAPATRCMKAGIRSAGCWPSESMVSAWVKPRAAACVRPCSTAAPLPPVLGQHHHVQAVVLRRHRLQASGACRRCCRRPPPRPGPSARAQPRTVS